MPKPAVQMMCWRPAVALLSLLLLGLDFSAARFVVEQGESPAYQTEVLSFVCGVCMQHAVLLGAKIGVGVPCTVAWRCA